LLIEVIDGHSQDGFRTYQGESRNEVNKLETEKVMLLEFPVPYHGPFLFIRQSVSSLCKTQHSPYMLPFIAKDTDERCQWISGVNAEDTLDASLLFLIYALPRELLFDNLKQTWNHLVRVALLSLFIEELHRRG